MPTLRVKIVVGSTRPGRFAEHAARFVHERARQTEGVEAELLDLRDYDMPFFSESVSPSFKQEPYKNEAVRRFTEKIGEGDAFVIVTPEYNHGTSGVLKNALDYVYQEWNNKPVAFVSYGSVGGARAVEHLRLVAVELQMAPVRAAVHIFAPWELLEEGKLKTGALDPYANAADHMLEQLLRWGRALKAVRV